MDQCAVQQQEYAYQSLQNLLNEIKQRFSEDNWNQLSVIQSNWETYRESDCRLYQELFEGGSIATMQYEICLYNHDVDRINQIKIYLCDGYGMTGPCDESNNY
jgi:uncharacterized protein YecT (DUF1311 family)